MKKLLLAAVATVALFGLAACGDSGKQEATPPATTTEPATPPAATTEPATPPADPNAPKPADPAAPAQ